MSEQRPSFRRRTSPPAIGMRVVAMGGLLLLAAGMLLARRVWLDRAPPTLVVVEVQGDVAKPGLVSVPSPARVHAAVRAAGGDPAGMVDATVEPGTRLVVAAGAWRAEQMDQVLVVGLPVDVNTASSAALQAIPGVGQTRAAAIIDERQRGGPFVDVADLQRVHGIGPATVEALRPFVIAEP